MKTIRVLIVDDQPQVREGLATLLKLASSRTSPGIEVVGEAQSGVEAIAQARVLQPDVVLMDLEMGGMDGYTATRQIKALQPAPRVIILSMHNGPQALQRAQAAGADAYVMKGTRYQILLNAILAGDRSDQTLDQDKGENL